MTASDALAVTFNDDELAAEAVDEAMTRASARWSKVAAFDNPGGWVYRVDRDAELPGSTVLVGTLR